MLTFKEVAVLDANSEYLGVPVETLMENAGYAVAKAVERELGTGLRIAVLCGCGNNGGDGFVAARYLRERNDVDVILAKTPESIRGQAAWANYERVQEISRVYQGQDLTKYQLIIDALLGTGTIGNPREPFPHIIEAINASKVQTVSVDIPSGIGSDNVVRPFMTVVFHDIKVGLTEKNAGRIIIEDIGIPPEASIYCGPGEYVYYPLPGKDSHKGQNGVVLVVGGGPYTGAPFLAAMGAYRIGADLVHVATPSSASSVIASFSPNVIVHPLPGSVLSGGDVNQIAKLMREAKAAVIGSGAGRDPKTFEALRALVKMCDLPMVIDADAFAALAGNLDILKGKKGILTPHGGEYLKLTGEELSSDLEQRKQQAAKLSQQTGMTVLIKGRIDVIADGERIRLNRTGNAGMSVGGTGDVLAGLCAGLLAKGMSSYQAARLAAFTNGAAGDLSFDQFSYGLLATDVLDHIPRVMRRSLENFNRWQ